MTTEIKDFKTAIGSLIYIEHNGKKSKAFKLTNVLVDSLELNNNTYLQIPKSNFKLFYAN